MRVHRFPQSKPPRQPFGPKSAEQVGQPRAPAERYSHRHGRPGTATVPSGVAFAAGTFAIHPETTPISPAHSAAAEAVTAAAEATAAANSATEAAQRAEAAVVSCSGKLSELMGFVRLGPVLGSGSRSRFGEKQASPSASALSAGVDVLIVAS